MKMMDLMIVGEPIGGFMLNVAQETKGADAELVDQTHCLYPELMDKVDELKRKHNLRSIAVYGNDSYIDNICRKLSEAYPTIVVQAFHSPY